MPSLNSDVIGRVKRLPLKPSATSSLMPLFEAVSNALHAVQDRYGDQASKAGEIEIEVLRKKAGVSAGAVSGFIVRDNGIGLNNENYESFLKPDSLFKEKRGGKGVGRLGWLRVFKRISVDSHYAVDGALKRRHFDFVLAANDQVKLKDEVPIEPKAGTKVILTEYDGVYETKCPAKWQTLVERLIGHFLPVFAAGSAPLISYFDGDEYLDLRQYFSDQIESQSEKGIEVLLHDGQKIALKIHNIRAHKAIRFERGKYHWLFLTANERAVEESPLDDVLGLKLLDGEYIYFGCASGDFLNEHVNQERNAFTFDSDDATAIRRALARGAREFLYEHIQAALEEKKKVTTGVISDNPQFIYIKSELTEFVEKLPPSAGSREEILVELSRHRFRRQREFKGVGDEIQKTANYTTAIAEKVADYKQFVQEEQKGALAEYVLKRRSVLDLLDKFSGFEDQEKGRHHLEQAIHELICPMQTDSSELDITDHNLWVADDRLAFFSFFASDKQFKSFSDVDSSERPDLAFFYDTCFAWSETEQNPNTVVLIEFKRPGREDYSDGDNPLDQVLNYVDRFKSSGSMKSAKGNVLSPNIKNATFHCYIIADLTDGLLKRMKGLGEQTPDGEGLFGYTNRPRVYFEIIPYAKLVRDAKARNAIFFQKLGLNDHGK